MCKKERERWCNKKKQGWKTRFNFLRQKTCKLISNSQFSSFIDAFGDRYIFVWHKNFHS